jgi:hypothetical protein
MEGAEFPNYVWSIGDFKEKWLSDVKVPKTYQHKQKLFQRDVGIVVIKSSNISQPMVRRTRRGLVVHPVDLEFKC